jgi:transposase-like protein
MKTKRSTNKRRVLTRYSVVDRERLISQYLSSGHSKAAFCRDQQINLGTFCGWLKRYPVSDGFTEVTVTPAISPPDDSRERIEVRFPGGVSVWFPAPTSTEETVRLIREVALC